MNFWQSRGDSIEYVSAKRDGISDLIIMLNYKKWMTKDSMNQIALDDTMQLKL